MGQDETRTGGIVSADKAESKPYAATGMGLDQYNRFRVMVTIETAAEKWAPVLLRHGLKLPDDQLPQFIGEMIQAIDQNVQSDFRTAACGKAGVPNVKDYEREESSEMGSQIVFGYSMSYDAAPLHTKERMAKEAINALKRDPADLSALNKLGEASAQEYVNWKNSGDMVEAAIDSYVQEYVTGRARFMEVISGRELSSLHEHPTLIPLGELAQTARTTASGHPIPAGPRSSGFRRGG